MGKNFSDSHIVKQRERLFFSIIQNLLKDLAEHANISGKITGLQRTEYNNKNGEVASLGTAVLSKIGGDIIGSMTFCYTWTFLEEDIQEIYPTGNIIISMKGKNQIGEDYDIEERNILIMFLTKHIVKFKTLANDIKIDLERPKR